MKSVVVISVAAGSTGFAEDKDWARKIRISKILPALARGEEVGLDFAGIHYATQSFVHALIGEALKKHGEECLDQLDFKNCSTQLQSLIELVVDYSLGGFPDQLRSSNAMEPTN
ncbi:MAG: STAS-like domain-containing protein [Gammaproteobacteria bacterium]